MQTNASDKKRRQEKEVVKTMIEIYCFTYHGKNTLCDSCKKLLDYSKTKIDNCPYMKEKTFCSACEVHCFDVHMRNKIREVMRFSGPRMIFHYPIMTIDHIFQSLKQKIIK